jgi:peptidoglycan/xylan/chitin deacetylase (PgdA/CDA1 family)
MSTSNNPWPQDARCAVLVTVNFDAESVDLLEVERANLCGRFLYGRYGMRAGVWRLLDLLRAHDLKATFFVPALDAENNPRQIEAVLRGGHEVAARGYAFEDHSRLGDAERDTLERAHRVLQGLTGRAPLGWRAPHGLLSPATLEHLTGLGYLYDSSFQDDDYPYVMQCASGKTIVELPTFQTLDDSTLYGAHHTSDRMLKIWMEEFDALYDTGALVVLTLHVRGNLGSSRASRVAVVDEFLNGVKRRPGVFFMTCAEMARWWQQHHPQTEPAPA